MVEDIQQLQRQAAQRVSRMQEHSRRVFNDYNRQSDTAPRGTQAAGFTQPILRSPGVYSRHTPPTPTDEASFCSPPINEESLCPPPPSTPDTAHSLDGEQWLLLGLALLLFRRGCRPELAIALLYLAL